MKSLGVSTGRVDVGVQVEVKVRVGGTGVEVGGTGVGVFGTGVSVGTIIVWVGLAVRVWATIVPIRSCGCRVGGNPLTGRQAERANA